MERSSQNVTIRMDSETKQQFEAFCDNVGINMTTAFNMFVKATLRSRVLPFPVTDLDPAPLSSRQRLKDAFEAMQNQSVKNGNDGITLEEINTIIAEVRREGKTAE